MMDRQECNICQGLKIGFRFVPSAREILLEFFIPVIQRKPLICNHLIKEADVYGTSSTPWEVFRDDDPYWIQTGSYKKKKTMYVFTRLCKNGKRVLRRAGCGTWIGQSNKKIKDKKSNEDIGCRGAFTFKIEKKMSSCVESDGTWCMYEYTLDDNFSKKLGLSQIVQGYAICEIIKRCNDNDNEISVNLPEASNQHDTDSFMPVGEVNQILPVVAQGVPNIDHEPWIDNYSSMPMGEVNQILPVAQGVLNMDHEPWINTNSSMPVGEVNQIPPAAQGVLNIDHEPWIDTNSSKPMGEVNQILPFAQGVSNIDHEPWIVNGSNYSQAANPQHVYNQNIPNIPMFPGDTYQSIPVAQGVLHNVNVPDYQPGIVNGNNQLAATNPLMDEGEVQSLMSFFASLPGKEFDDFMQNLK